MIALHSKIWRGSAKVMPCGIIQRSTVSKPKKAKETKYTHTVLMPKTTFPQFLNSKEVEERDLLIQRECKFLDYYSWQRENMRGKEFVLHDGPPYANGRPHIGHAVNKIFKDITLRSKLIRGRRVHFIPGWDCHGLPIELKAVTDSDCKLSQIEVRQKAREFAYSASQVQMETFKHWGVLGDWDNQCYYTYDKSYVSNELQLFWEFYQKKLIYHDLKPVYWSPSSRTALAESELIYKDDHSSQALTLRLEVTSDTVSDPTYLLTWTTTPWTLPVNVAVCFSSDLQYTKIKIASLAGSYIIASDLIENLQSKLQQPIEIVGCVTHEELRDMKYRHPWKKGVIGMVIEASHVKKSGTGLVHTAPAHGNDDFILALKQGLKMECHVDEAGCFTKEAGPDLAGRSVLDDGSNYVIKTLESEIVFQEKYTHSYPYDWRTDKPVIIRASWQWFINTEALKTPALESLSHITTDVDYLKKLIESRPYWCLSRQRCWGVPMPVFYHRLTGRPLISKTLIDHLRRLIESSSPDVWWLETTDKLFPAKVCKELFVKIEDVVKGGDIMDIWFDSGTSWSAVLDGKQSDVCIEGRDQFSGWFQSSLLTSVALQGKAPYKKLVVHGFVVDEFGKKMSKSLGNVMDPDDITKGEKALGVDLLRWWVAGHAHDAQAAVYSNLLKENAASVQKIRSILRYLLGSINDLSVDELNSVSKLSQIDLHLLNSCRKLYDSIMNYYDNYQYNLVCQNLLNFVANDVSAIYVLVIKDRLYCDLPTSERRLACRFVLHGILNTLTHCIAPVLPHLSEEIYLHHPLYKGKPLFYNSEMWAPPKSWNDESASDVINVALNVREKFTAAMNAIDGKASKTFDKTCTIEANENEFHLLKKMQLTEESTDSELTEFLQVSTVRLVPGCGTVLASPSHYLRCPRCRRCNVLEENSLCSRCNIALQIC